MSPLSFTFREFACETGKCQPSTYLHQCSNDALWAPLCSFISLNKYQLRPAQCKRLKKWFVITLDSTTTVMEEILMFLAILRLATKIMMEATVPQSDWAAVESWDKTLPCSAMHFLVFVDWKNRDKQSPLYILVLQPVNHCAITASGSYLGCMTLKERTGGRFKVSVH